MRNLVSFIQALVIAFVSVGVTAADTPRPNILWITCEDISPNLGCYGDGYAVTPNLDRLATESTRYTAAFAPIGVCAPARSCLITGMYPTSLGSQHMRCQAVLPEYVHCFSEYLRDAGYYSTNNVKTDYNFEHRAESWDESSGRAHWRGRAEGQPFFAVVNFTSCHESQIRLPEAVYQKRTADFTDAERHDPALAPLPPYHPDEPEVRKDWARYYDMITFMDKEVGRLLAELEADGLADETIVFFYSDHGAGMPRSKRWLYDSSLKVPLLVRFPETYARWAPTAAGATTDRLVSFVDFAPTVLSLAGVDIPAHMQGVAFLGDESEPPREYIYGYRDRMDERYDMIRCVRDERFKYIRNYMPQLPYFQHQYLDYLYQMPTMQVWQRLSYEGKLSGPAAQFMAMRKPIEELYDTEADPWEVNNLADDVKYHDVRHRLRGELYNWMLEIRDLGFMPEPDMRTRFGDVAPYDAVRARPASYPLKEMIDLANLATTARTTAAEVAPNVASVADIFETLLARGDTDPAMRYWAVVGLGDLDARQPVSDELIQSLVLDPHEAPSVRLAAADVYFQSDKSGDDDAAVLDVLIELLGDENQWVRVMAANVLGRLDRRAASRTGAMRAALENPNEKNQYVVRVMTHTLSELEDGGN
jgi:uncharacterized sulfatase